MEDTEAVNHECECGLYNYEEGSYPAWFLKNVQALRSEGYLMDVTLCAEGKELPCHRLVLSGCSSYFEAMFCGGLSESKKDRIEIGGVSAEALQLLVDYAYTAKITITTDNVQPLFEAANMLQFKAVELSCEKFLEERLSNETCLGIWALADRMSCADLRENARLLALKNFDLVCKTEDFLEVPGDFLKIYISDHGLYAKKEERVVEVIMLWTRHKLEERQRYLEELMKCVRFSNVDKNYLANIMETDKVFAGVSGIKKLIKDQSRHPKPRQIVQEEIFILGHSDMYRLDLQFVCEDISDLPQPLHGCVGTAVCVINNDIVVTGGFVGSEPNIWSGGSLSHVWRYNSSLNSWTRLASMRIGRLFHGVTVMQGQAYVVGGLYAAPEVTDSEENSTKLPLSDVEVYNETMNTWNMIEPMQQPVNLFGIATCCGKIYVFGGTRRFVDRGYDGLQCYDPIQNVWTFGKSLPKAVKCIKACTINSKIYLVGGQLECVLCYDPQDDIYEKLAEKLSPWDDCSATVCGTEIIVTGGCRCIDDDETAEDHNLKFQVFDVSSGFCWMSDDDMPVPVRGKKTVTLLNTRLENVSSI